MLIQPVTTIAPGSCMAARLVNQLIPMQLAAQFVTLVSKRARACGAFAGFWARALAALLMLLVATTAAGDNQGHTVTDHTGESQRLRVVTDILPVQSLVQSVAGDLHEVSTLIDGDEQAHHHSLKPSSARHVHEADIFIQIGDSLTPWLKEYRKSLPDHVTVISLNALPVTQTLPLFDEDDTAIGGTEDPHSWLNPDNALAWLDVIRDALTEKNHTQAEVYAMNAAAAKTQLQTVINSVETQLASLPEHYALVDHDAMRYFQQRFTLPSAKALFSHDDIAPGPAGLRRIRQHVSDNGINCMLVESPKPETLLDTVFDGRQFQTVPLDLMGRHLPAGSGLYTSLLLGVASSVLSCVS